MLKNNFTTVSEYKDFSFENSLNFFFLCQSQIIAISNFIEIFLNFYIITVHTYFEIIRIIKSLKIEDNNVCWFFHSIPFLKYIYKRKALFNA